MSREQAIEIAGALNDDFERAGVKAEATTWLKQPGKERVYLQSTGRKGGTRLGHVDAASGKFTPERFAGKNHASADLVSRINDVLSRVVQPPTPVARSGLSTMASARAGNVSQGGSPMQRLMAERLQSGRVSGPTAGTASNARKVGGQS